VTYRMNNPFKEAELVIFDLDGTLYEGKDHFHYYAQRLCGSLPQDAQLPYIKEYESILQGKHILSVGKVYDAARDTVLVVEPFTYKVTAGWHWTSQSIDEETLKRLYPTPVLFDAENIIAVGDGWWLPYVCAKRYGMLFETGQKLYLQTKEMMGSAQFSLAKVEGLKEGLIHLKKKAEIVLLTNSDALDVRRLLVKLELQDVFDTLITEGQKPLMTIKHMTELLENYLVMPSKALSVGDNLINEILPALKLGAKTIWIDSGHLHESPEYEGMRVRSISEVIQLMLEV